RGPVGQRQQQLCRRPAERGEGVLDPDRDFCVDLPAHEPVALETPEGVREHLLRSAAEIVIEPAVPANAARQQIEQVDLPLRGQEVSGPPRALDHLEVLVRESTGCTWPAGGVDGRQVVSRGHALSLSVYSACPIPRSFTNNDPSLSSCVCRLSGRSTSSLDQATSLCKGAAAVIAASPKFLLG